MSFRSYDLLKLVEDHGQEATLRKVTAAGTYNPATGTVDNSSTTDYSIKCYFYNYENGLMINQEEIRRGTRKCLIAAKGLTVVPDDEDQIVGFNDTVDILSVVSIFSGTEALCYICDVRE